MALDINEQVSNAYNAAKQALNDDLKQNLYNATKARVQAFRQINNNANASHSLYSGAPAGMQMNYDQQTYIPNIGKLATMARLPELSTTGLAKAGVPYAAHPILTRTGAGAITGAAIAT